MQSRLSAFIQVLRSHDVRVSPAETLDAMAVVAALGYAKRQQLRDGLAMSLAKTAREEAVVLRCFDLYFERQMADFKTRDTALGADFSSAQNPEQSASELSELAPNSASSERQELEQAAQHDPALEELLQSELMQHLLDNKRAELSLAIGQAAAEVGLNNIQLFTQKGQYTRRILDALGEEALRKASLSLEQADSPLLETLGSYRDKLRQQVSEHVEREYLLLSEGRNRQLSDQLLSRTRLSHLENRYLQRVQELLRKMAKKLADKYSHKPRQGKRGRLDMARTLRGSIANDGLMFDTYWRRKRKNKSQILAICDVSGSVAAYAKFLLLFLYSLQDVLPKVRSFAFSSHLAEVSQLFREHSVERAIELANWRYGGATDYGASLVDFARLALDDINHSTTVIILGDARNNGGDPRLDIMQSIYQRSRRVIWLNPESRRAWGSGDSEMLRYQSACHLVAECNNLQQLERIVDQLLKQS